MLIVQISCFMKIKFFVILKTLTGCVFSDFYQINIAKLSNFSKKLSLRFSDKGNSILLHNITFEGLGLITVFIFFILIIYAKRIL